MSFIGFEQLRRAAYTTAILAAASIVASCSGGQPPAPGAIPNALVQRQIPARSSLANFGAHGSPFVRTLADGSIVHVHPFPNVGVAYLNANLPDHVEYHNGPVVISSTMYAIFWQPTGTYMSPKYKPTIGQFFSDVGATAQYNILTQYSDTSGPILNRSTFGGAWTDTSAYPSDFNNGNTGDKDLHAEVRKAIAANHWPSGGDSNVFVILTASKSPADNWAACAYHGSFVSNGGDYIYAIVPYQHDYGAHGCGTPSNVWPNDRDADQTIDTMWHEQAESISDPITVGNRGAWYSNRSGAEIGDLCQTSYGKLRANGSDVTLHGHDYVTQEIWSNFNYRCYQTQAHR